MPFRCGVQSVVFESIRIATVAAIGPLLDRAPKKLFAARIKRESKVPVQTGECAERVLDQLRVANVKCAMRHRSQRIGGVDEHPRSEPPSFADLSPNLDAIDVA